LRSQLDQERTDREEVEVQLADREKQVEELRSQLSELKQNLAVAREELPEPANALNRLKAKRKKSKADLGDVMTLWEILEE
jgi:chromosome segregation ATPase